MRTRVGNPSNEAHGQTMRVYDWIAPAGTDPHEAGVKAAAALGVKLHANDGEAHGYVSTSRRPDGSLYVAIHLYDFTCDDDHCDKGEGAIVLRTAPDVTAKLAACKAAVGEHAKHKLGGKDDGGTLKALGFRTAEEHLIARGSPKIEPVDAHRARCVECGAVTATDGPLR